MLSKHRYSTCKVSNKKKVLTRNSAQSMTHNEKPKKNVLPLFFEKAGDNKTTNKAMKSLQYTAVCELALKGTLQWHGMYCINIQASICAN